MVSQAKDRGGRDFSYREALSWLYGLQKLGIKFGLSKTANLLQAFGNPHVGQRYIHIAGTNGKGSVGVMLESMLMKSGLKVGFYSSPHLVSFTERFRVNGDSVSREAATSLITEIREVIGQQQLPTFFEFTTAMGLIHFFRSHVDVGIIEVGMGGRLDATNIITPMISVITSIGLDHREFLGNTLIDIAQEKAGIIKEGVDMVTAVQQPSVARLLQSLCKIKAAAFWRVGHHVHYRRLPSGLLSYYGLKKDYQELELGLKGRFQYRNAALALLAVEILQAKGLGISDDAVRSGLSEPVWPGRLEMISARPTIILDGAHNPSAMKSLAYTIGKDFDFRRLIVVLGVMGDKDIYHILKEIVPLAHRVIYTRATYTRAADPHYLMDEARGFGKAGEVYATVPAAIERAKDLAGTQDLIVITGSLYVVGEAKAYCDSAHSPVEPM